MTINLFTELQGVYADGLAVGIKDRGKDLSFLFFPNAKAIAATLTQNQFAAACVKRNQRILKRTLPKAIIINSGNANAGTGEQGILDNKQIAKEASNYLSCDPNEVLVASTGCIGKPLPMDIVLEGMRRLLKDPEKKQAKNVAEAILTTDTTIKMVSKSVQIGKKVITVSGIAKGSGMIAPNMATMLAFLFTDAALPSDDLQRVFTSSVNRSFNMISVDGDTSTNDMAFLVSLGPKKFLKTKAHHQAFQDLVDAACIDLAKQIVIDGEGATTCIEMVVKGAASVSDAKHIALAIINSPLVKTAIHGADPNWGRIIAAAGKNPTLKFNMNKIDVMIGNTVLFSQGQPQPFDKQAVGAYLKEKEVLIVLNLNLAHSEARVWGCDLSAEYIKINTQYT